MAPSQDSADPDSSILPSSLVRVLPDSRVNSASPQAQLLWKMVDQAPQAGLLQPALYAVLKGTLFSSLAAMSGPWRGAER